MHQENIIIKPKENARRKNKPLIAFAMGRKWMLVVTMRRHIFGWSRKGRKESGGVTMKMAAWFTFGHEERSKMALVAEI